jgi:hypothetical protein
MATNYNKTIILQRRSATSGSNPTTSTLQVGEIALNTYDGTAFIHKSGSAESIEQIVVANSTTIGSITLTETGSFGELVVTNDVNIAGGVYVTGDIVGNGDIDIAGAVSASIVSASIFYGDGSGLQNVVISDANNYDFNETPAASMAGVFSGSLYGIGDVLAFSGSVATRLANLEASASLLDAGQF